MNDYTNTFHGARVLITGGLGFIGSMLARRLVDLGAQVTLVDSLIPTYGDNMRKMAGEWYHILYNNVYGIRACALRLTNTYGPGMRVKDTRQTFLGIWIKQLIDGEPIQIWGDGMQIRDFNYVDDTVDALLLCAAT